MTLTPRDMKLLTAADPRLQRLAEYLANNSSIPFMVLETNRSREAQQIAFDTGHSHARPGQSAHDYLPSLAFDLAPLPIDWKDTTRFITLAHVAKQAAITLAIDITWGGDWHSIVDMPHFEITSWREEVRLYYNATTGLRVKSAL